MATVLFPRKIPDAVTLHDLINHCREFELGTNRHIIVYPGTKSQVVLPPQYQIHMACFLWRETIIRLILRFSEQMDLEKVERDNLIMILQYMDNIFKRVTDEARGLQGNYTDFHSKTFDEYLIIEYYVRRHEPFEVRDFRRTNDINLNWMKVEECDWKQYMNDMGPLWSGDRNHFKLLAPAQTLKAATSMLECVHHWYPYCIVPDSYFGYTYHEHEGSSEEDSDIESEDDLKNIQMVSATDGSKKVKGNTQRVSKSVGKVKKAVEKQRKGKAKAKKEEMTSGTVRTHCMVTRASQKQKSF